MRSADAPQDETQDLSLAELPPVRVVAVDRSQAPLMPDVTGGSRARALPKRQPKRALAVLLGYIAVISLSVGPMLLIFGGAVGGLLIFALACLLTVPVALLAPRPTQASELLFDKIPVLKRPSSRPTDLP